MATELSIPTDLLPRDGRFGSGPSRVRDAQIQAIVDAQPTVLGTSHRQAPVKKLVKDVRESLAALYQLPDGYEVLLGNGGSTSFWDAATFSLVERRAQHCAFGEFGAKFAKATTDAPHLEASDVIEAPAGEIALPVARDGIDVYAWPHNETSTGAMAPVIRPEGASDALTVIDGTSAAGGLALDVTQADVYYFAPQKSFGSDGGLWFALVSPAAIERIERVAASGRYIPETLALANALQNSRLEQTLNTPALTPLIMMREQLSWMLDGGGMDFVTGRTSESARRIYQWADASEYAVTFVTQASARSSVVATVDLLPPVDSTQLRSVLRSAGVVDIDPYRKLGRNQIRVGMFPSVDPDDVSALTASIDWIVERLLT
ncbi:phosphoserine transaminase [Demequina sp. NBRC 110051]|uniref:phosphoserine transaminase n=1 Tax=Demequina sp. NBRC 110051 TaxID=1570340 RepID=UPI000A071D9E|nr:phosphoserine transaminase [Demequina sp. NBRC 110051]